MDSKDGDASNSVTNDFLRAAWSRKDITDEEQLRWWQGRGKAIMNRGPLWFQ